MWCAHGQTCAQKEEETRPDIVKLRTRHWVLTIALALRQDPGLGIEKQRVEPILLLLKKVDVQHTSQSLDCGRRR